MTPKVGDTVVIKAIVDSVGSGCFSIQLRDDSGRTWVNNKVITEIIPAPLVPKIGDVLRFNGAGIRYKILGLHDGLIWVEHKNSKLSNMSHSTFIFDPTEWSLYDEDT